MDKGVYMAWQEMDRQQKQQRVKMDRKVKEEREETDRKIQLQRARVDIKLREERAALYESLKQWHRDIDQYLMQERENMDKMLKAERFDIDCMIERERVRMDADKMQLRVEMERKRQKDCDNVKLNLPLEEQLQNDTTPPYLTAKALTPSNKPVSHSDSIINSTRHVAMKFRVHMEGRFSMNPYGYAGGRMEYMTFPKIEWGFMVEKLYDHGYKGIADLFYLDPAREASDGFVLMKGPEHVDQLLRDHEGRQICDLYIVKYSAISSDYEDGSDTDDDSTEKEDAVDNPLFDIENLKAFLAQSDYPDDPTVVTTKKGHMHENPLKKSGGSTVDDGVSSEKRAYTNLAYGHKFKRSRYPWGFSNKRYMRFKKAESLQPKKQQAIEHDGNPVKGGGSDSD